MSLLSAALRLLSVSYCLMTSAAVTRDQDVVRLVVKEGSDVTLPCSLQQNIAAALFDWRKVDQGGRPREVFQYEAGDHYNNNGGTRQSLEFRGRVAHFPDELKHGNASIVIRNTKMADGGNYSCAFPRLQTPQTFYVQLVVDLPFRDRSAESSAATPEPFIRTLHAAEDWARLQCEVRGASPEPRVRWQDGDGNQLPAEEPEVRKRGSSYDITLNVTVTKTGRYRCVVEQQELKHSIASETFVHICEKVCEDSSSRVAIGWCGGGCVVGGVIVLAVQALVKCNTKRLINRASQPGDDAEKEKKKNGVKHGVIYKPENSSSNASSVLLFESAPAQ